MQLCIQSLPEWVELLSLASCIGSLFGLLWILPPLAGENAYSAAVRGRLRVLFIVGSAVMFGAGLVDLPVRAVEMSGSSFPEVLSLIPAVVLRTHYGSVWLLRIAALLIASAVAWRTKGRRSPAVLIFLLVLMIAVIVTESASGHPSDKGDFTVPELMDGLHLFAASVWGGGLLVLSGVILPGLPAEGASMLTADAAARFSRIAGCAAAAVAVTSLYNGWIYGGSIDGLFKTAYGWTLSFKIILFLVVVGYAAYNRYVLVPLLRQGGMAGDRQERDAIASSLSSRLVPSPGRDPLLRFTQTLRVEAVLIVIVLFCAALLRHETPGRHAAHGTSSHHAHVQSHAEKRP